MRILKKFFKKYFIDTFFKKKIDKDLEVIKKLVGSIKSEQNRLKNSKNINEFEFKVFSQFGEDGIIQHIINNINIKKKFFVEFGVENYEEANTRFLLENNNWSGLIIDSSKDNIQYIKNKDYYWKNKLIAIFDFINAENINQIIKKNDIVGQIGLLSIDIDGNDYWVWNNIDIIQPDIVIIEYNARLGFEKSLTIPYDKNFKRGFGKNKIFYGASLNALYKLGTEKGYNLVATNLNGNNAFFIKKDLLNNTNIVSKLPKDCFNVNTFSEILEVNGNIIKNEKLEKELIEKYPFIEV